MLTWLLMFLIFYCLKVTFGILIAMRGRPGPRPPVVVFGFEDIKPGKYNDNFVARCKFCIFGLKRYFSFSRNFSSNLTRHLKSKHFGQYKKFLNRKLSRAAEIVPTSDSLPSSSKQSNATVMKTQTRKCNQMKFQVTNYVVIRNRKHCLIHLSVLLEKFQPQILCYNWAKMKF